MIHYSILPAELVNYDWNEKTPTFKEVELEGVSVLVQLENESEGAIARILSMNPMDYLNPRLQPGNRVHFSLKYKKDG